MRIKHSHLLVTFLFNSVTTGCADDSTPVRQAVD
mgnify:CR=1 FL=1